MFSWTYLLLQLNQDTRNCEIEINGFHLSKGISIVIIYISLSLRRNDFQGRYLKGFKSQKP